MSSWAGPTRRRHYRWPRPRTAWSGSRSASSSNLRRTGRTFITPDSQAPAEKTLQGSEQGRRLGSDGTPEVLEFCVAELGTSIETSDGSARALMADALDLRHRLPELWQLIMAGSVQA